MVKMSSQVCSARTENGSRNYAKSLMRMSEIDSLSRALLQPQASVSFPIQLKSEGEQNRCMSWNNIRLELACAPRYPQGSPHRCYLLHLPLEASGMIDEELVRTAPMRATVRRFWPSQPDLRGYVIKMPKGWAFTYESREDGDETKFHLESHPMRVGECIILTEPDGARLPFRVTDVQ